MRGDLADLAGGENTPLVVDGGEAGSGSDKFISADSADALGSAFDSIANLVVSCDYTVDPPRFRNLYTT